MSDWREHPSYLRTTMLDEADPRRETCGYFLEPATLDDLLKGMDRLLKAGHYFDMNQWPFHHHGVVCGNFADISAAFSVPVPIDRQVEVDDILRVMRRRSSDNEYASRSLADAQRANFARGLYGPSAE